MDHHFCYDPDSAGCLIDIFRSEFPNELTKWAWCAMVVFVPLIGAVLYYWFGTEQKVVSKS